MTHSVGVAFSAVVGIISLALTAIAFAASRRTQDRRLLWVTAAFGVFFVKAVLVVLSWPRIGLVETEALEIVGNLLDLVILVLLVAPLMQK